MAKKDFQLRIKKARAKALFKEHQLNDAMALFMEITRIDQSDPEIWYMMGVIASQQGEKNKALGYFRNAVKLYPDSAAGWYNLGQACKDVGRFEEAASSYEAALRIQPDWPDAWNNLGHLLSYLGRKHDAVESFRRALAIKPDYTAAWQALSRLLTQAGELDEAMVCIRELQQLIPDNLDTKVAELKIMQRQGQIDQAFAIALQLHESHADNLEVEFLYGSLCRQSGHIEDAIKVYEDLLTNRARELDQQGLSILHYRLGDLYDTRQNYRQAFDHYQSANLLKSRAYNAKPFNMEFLIGLINNLIINFSHESISKLPKALHSSERPIFIVGMPRSGTTLVEQILASHPDVYGGGELKEIDAIASRVLKIHEGDHPLVEIIDKLGQTGCDALAKQYLDFLSKLSATARFVTDKMPQNFLHLGFISLLFPRAHVIHCVRDPRDTCLSCFFQDFSSTHGYTYDLEVLGKYYNEYRRLMRHWRDVLDIPILDVNYEALVADQEGLTRTMLEFCNLEWDDRCLRFHENKRIVNTASREQVSTPVYTRSLERWRHYEPFIQPLIEALEL